MKTIKTGLLLFSILSSIFASSLYLYNTGGFLYEEYSCPTKVRIEDYFGQFYLASPSIAEVVRSKGYSFANISLDNGTSFYGILSRKYGPYALNISGKIHIFPESRVASMVVEESPSKRYLSLSPITGKNCSVYWAIPSSGWGSVYVLNDKGSLIGFASIDLPSGFSKELDLFLIGGSFSLFPPQYFRKDILEFASFEAPPPQPTEASFYYSYELGKKELNSSNLLFQLFSDNVELSIVNSFTYYEGANGPLAGIVKVSFTPNNPMPSGSFVYLERGVVSGISSVGNLPAGRPAEAMVGSPFNVLATATSKKTISSPSLKEYEVNVTFLNYGVRTQKAELKVPIYSNSEVQGKGFEEKEGYAIFSTEIEPGGKKVISFKLRVRPYSYYP